MRNCFLVVRNLEQCRSKGRIRAEAATWASYKTFDLHTFFRRGLFDQFLQLIDSCLTLLAAEKNQKIAPKYKKNSTAGWGISHWTNLSAVWLRGADGVLESVGREGPCSLLQRPGNTMAR